MRKYIIFFALVSALCSFTFLTNNYFSDLVDEKLSSYAKTFAPEKIYIHTDKPTYGLDETIWFNSYLVDGVFHEKSNKSWVVHVELFNENDSLVAKRRLFNKTVSSAGDFKIEKSWKPGIYKLQAYTNYMKNGSPEYFFSKDILIFDDKSMDDFAASLDADISEDIAFRQSKPELGIFPEGGYLVDGLRSKVAIKIEGIGLEGPFFDGALVDDNDQIITRFKTGPFGSTVFVITPAKDVDYSIKLEVNEVEYSYKLPKPLEKGHVIEVNNQGESIIINATSNQNLGLANTYLVAHQRGHKVFGKFQTEALNNYTLKIPKKDLQDGIMHVTLFDNEGLPVCERLIFVSNVENTRNIKISKANELVKNKSRQTINLQVEDVSGNPVSAYLSMSVRDLKAVENSQYDEDIRTYLLLNSDLRGKIEKPGYFFDGQETGKKQYLLDLVMLTNGWRRFNWQELLYTQQKSDYAPEKGLFISGQTKSLRKPYGPLASSNRLTFFMENNVTQEPVQQSNAQGEFKFGPFIFFDTIPTIIESRITDFSSKNDKDRKILILLNETTEKTKLFKTDSLSEKTSRKKQIENYARISNYLKRLRFEIDQNVQKLNEVTVIAQKESDYDKRRRQLNDLTDYGFPTNRLDVETDFEDSGQSVFDLLNMVPGVNAFNDSIQIRGSSGQPVILLDKFQVDADMLSTLRVSDVSFIDVLKGAEAAMYANSGNGVIAIYSRTGNVNLSRNVKRKPGIIDFVADGFYLAKTFYSPDYSSGFFMDELDYRTTLHWEPKIIIDTAKGKQISFYTSDLDSEYLIEVEGITANGIPVRATSTFSVE